MTDRVLTARQLDRALLARQLLLERSDLPIPRALERVAGLQTQYAPTGYVGLWSRVRDVRRDDLTRALARRSVIQGTLMRGTIHMVSRRDYPWFAEAVRRARRDWWMRAAHRPGGRQAIEAAAKRVRDALADGPRRRADLVRELGLDSTTWNAVGLWLDLVRVPPSGTWEQRRADLYALADDWVGPAPEIAERDAVDLLVRRYLAAFGPASRKDVAGFTGLSLTALSTAFDRLPLRRFRDERGGELVDEARAPLPDPDVPAPVRFLGTWEAPLLVHARRTQVLPEPLRQKVFHTKTPHSVNTFLVDGQVAGTWRFERGVVRVQPFVRLAASARRDVREESERLAEFMS
jgi:Winged helix DNA-binding domain